MYHSSRGRCTGDWCTVYSVTYYIIVYKRSHYKTYNFLDETKDACISTRERKLERGSVWKRERESEPESEIFKIIKTIKLLFYAALSYGVTRRICYRGSAIINLCCSIGTQQGVSCRYVLPVSQFLLDKFKIADL